MSERDQEYLQDFLGDLDPNMLSNCCGAVSWGPTDICSQCYEHAAFERGLALDLTHTLFEEETDG